MNVSLCLWGLNFAIVIDLRGLLQFRLSSTKWFVQHTILLLHLLFLVKFVNFSQQQRTTFALECSQQFTHFNMYFLLLHLQLRQYNIWNEFETLVMLCSFRYKTIRPSPYTYNFWAEQNTLSRKSFPLNCEYCWQATMLAWNQVSFPELVRTLAFMHWR